MNRDDTFKITREDVWRELELLPAWKLRTPVEVLEPAKVETVKHEKLKATESVIETPEKPISTPITQYEITMSQDQQWAFLCELGMPASSMDIGLQSTLFNNILHALSIEKPRKIRAQSIVDIQAKIIVAMGESVAQALLNTQGPLEALRGKLHPLSHAQLVVTYDIPHLLNNPLDKAKVWQDLCLASSYFQGLHVQD